MARDGAANDRAVASEEDAQRSGSESPPSRRGSAHDREIAAAFMRTDADLLPYDDAEVPPLPSEAPPEPEDDGWSAHETLPGSGQWYFYNRFTGVRQWENPRVPGAAATNNGSYDRSDQNSTAAQTTSSAAPGTSSPPKPKRKYGGYNPKIHGNYDPNADYAREAEREEEEEESAATAAAAGLPVPTSGDYSMTAHFNRFTGRFQQASMNPEYHNDENKSKRQMSAFFDVDAAANSHDGRSLKAERRNRALSKKELQAFKEKRKEKQKQKKLAWLKD